MANISSGNKVPGAGSTGTNFTALNPANRGGGGISTVKGMGIPSEELGRNTGLFEPELTKIDPVGNAPEGELTSIPGPVTRLKKSPIAAPSSPAIVKPFGFNVEKFKSTALQKDVMKNNLFLVTIYFPRRVGSSEYKFEPQRQDVELIPMFCNACKLPSMTLITQDIVSRYGYDITEKMPVLPDFQDIPFTFISDGRGEVISFFDRWMNHIINFDDTRGIGVAGSTKNPAQRPYEVSYKDDFSAVIEIITYSPRSERIFVHTLYEAFPKSLYNVDLNWAFTNELATFDVLITFRNYKLVAVNQQKEWSRDSGIGSLSTFQTLIKGATAAQTLSTVLKKPQSIGDVISMVNAGGIVYRNFNFAR